MKLKDSPAVFSRISLLLQHSNEFRNYMSVPGTTGADLSDELKAVRRDTEKVVDYFSLAENKTQKNIAKQYLDSINATAWFIFLLREASEIEAVPSTTGLVNMDFVEDELIIKIKGPITKSEYKSMWQSVCHLQFNFLHGFSDNPIATRASEYLKELNRIFKKYGKEDLLESELQEVAVRRVDIWKKNPKEQLDEDLLIFRLARTHRKKEAESVYKKIKLVQFLKEKHAKVDKKDESEDFQSLCYKYYPDLTNASDAVITKTLRLKPFGQRVQETKEAWGFAT